MSDRLAAEGLQARLSFRCTTSSSWRHPPPRRSGAAAVLKEEMEAAASLKVKLAVDVHTGATWYDAKG